MTDYRNLFSLAGRTALVTGSSRGIGAAIARGFAVHGARVVVHGQSPGATARVEREIAEAGGEAVPIACDLSPKGAGRETIARAKQAAGPIDILVINASAQINGDFADVGDDEFSMQVDVNLRSTVEMLQAVLPGMAERGWGRVVNIGSINQLRPKSIVSIYAATKAAQHNLVQSLARDYARHGVLLNTLAPGLVDTDRNADGATAIRRVGQTMSRHSTGWAAPPVPTKWSARRCFSRRTPAAS